MTIKSRDHKSVDQSPKKKVYRTPRLLEYGNIHQITQTQRGGEKNDGGSGKGNPKKTGGT